MKVSTKLFNEQQVRQFSSLNEDIQKLQDAGAVEISNCKAKL